MRTVVQTDLGTVIILDKLTTVRGAGPWHLAFCAKPHRTDRTNYSARTGIQTALLSPTRRRNLFSEFEEIYNDIQLHRRRREPPVLLNYAAVPSEAANIGRLSDRFW